jgi:hypothetical protein
MARMESLASVLDHCDTEAVGPRDLDARLELSGAEAVRGAFPAIGLI